ncbi:hypothetical protein BES34_013105 [Leptospira inadai serovar Lyme]|uniref:Uncharacterized protein n=1 Tax=Leptospira inadai serovar Lyme TaxID=293084 RepID=A0ABX4YGT2_9LEPT|nr:hypothetical protein BES34_013105 [Leptospira inadai serovar Lyme]
MSYQSHKRNRFRQFLFQRVRVMRGASQDFFQKERLAWLEGTFRRFDPFIGGLPFFPPRSTRGSFLRV